MRHAQPVEWIGQPALGYMVNTGFDDANRRAIGELTGRLSRLDDAVFWTPPETLHVTLLDWIAPLADYDGQNKDDLFMRLKPRYDRILSAILSESAPIESVIDEIQVSPSTIFLKGRDDGQFQSIRQRFVEQAGLEPGTKPPPRIIHTSIGRFTRAVELEPVEAAVAAESINLLQLVADFRLVRSTREPFLEHTLLKRYSLN